LVAAAAYMVATIEFARKGQWVLALGWFTTVISVVVWSFVKEIK
jgi:hypothetical protein